MQVIILDNTDVKCFKNNTLQSINFVAVKQFCKSLEEVEQLIDKTFSCNTSNTESFHKVCARFTQTEKLIIWNMKWS